MKHLIFSVALAFAFVLPAQAQGFDFLKAIFGKSESEQKSETKADSGTTDTMSKVAAVLSQSDAEEGLKEALVVGARTVATQLSAENGYFGDANVKIPLPGQIGKLQKNLAKFGLSGTFDDLQLRVNRAAEAAAPQAVDLVVSAVQDMSFEDAISLVNGGDTAATDYLRLKTQSELEGLIRPHLESALADAGALSIIDDLAGKYDLSQFNIDPHKDIVDHSVDKALEGLFFYLAKEEKEIRSNPVERTTDILRKVFGG